MKRLLLLFTILATLSLSNAQVPPNDLVENAIEIDTPNFVDENLRLDLAAINAGGQNDCALAGFTSVYYKFMATFNGVVSFSLLNQENNSSPVNSFIILFTAPNLNVASDSDLTLASSCAFSTQTSINITSGQSYYAIVHRPDVGALSRVTATISQDATPEERQALIDFYNATDGPNWSSPFFSTATWNTAAPLSDWEGVTVENGHVVALHLINFNVTGQLPIAILDLPFLERFNLEDNNLTGIIPDLTVLPNLETFNIFQNRFTFEHLEPNFTQNATIPEFLYASQQRINDEQVIDDVVLGQEYTFSTTTIGTDLSYQWVKDDGGGFLTPEEIPGATNADYVIPSLAVDDIFGYSCRVTSALVPDLTLLRNRINLRTPVSQTERDALIAIYNSLDGPNWDNNENWLSTADVDDWQGVQTVGGKVVILALNFQNLNGQLPDELGDLIHLKEIRMSVNPNLTGPIPSTIGNITDLEFLRFQSNSMSGEIPTSVSNLTKLTRVYLQENQFSGSIPSGFGNAPQLFQIILNDNQLEGQLPESLGNLSMLESFNVSNNNLIGTIPSNFENWSSLLFFSIANNDFSGALPDWSMLDEPENAGINLVNNFFDFSDLEALVNNGVSYQSLVYSPQRTLDEEQEIISDPGADITLNVDDTNIERDSDDTAMTNQFQWYKDNVAITGANANTYTIFNAQQDDSGIYFCEITNTSLPDLVLRRANISVLITNPDFTLDTNGVTCLCPNANFGDVGTLIINGDTKTFTKRTETELRNLIAANIADPQIALTCTSGITDMSNLFNVLSGVDGLFNQNIAYWDVSQVTQMTNMFGYQSAFNQPLNSWNVSNVNNMNGMFQSTVSFNQPINNWDVSQVTGMFAMFESNTAFNQPLDNWDVANVTDMGFMFSFATAFNQPLNNWDVGSVTNMRQMMTGTPFNRPLDSWDVSNVTNMQAMFFDTPFNQAIDTWDVGNVTTMSQMFSLAVFNQPLNNWDVSNVQNMVSMFSAASFFNQPLDNWDVSQVTFMNSMFNNATAFNQDISGWCVSQLPTEPQGFANLSALQTSFFPNWGAECEVLTIDEEGLGIINIYPNPTKNWLNIKTYNLTDADLSIYDINGRLILTKTINGSLYALNVEHLQSGTYILKIDAQNKIQTQRFIKQ